MSGSAGFHCSPLMVPPAGGNDSIPNNRAAAFTADLTLPPCSK